MKVYLYSETPAHLKINGEYYGKVNDNTFLIEENFENPFFEFLPINTRYLPVYGSENSKELRNFSVKGGQLVYPVYPIKNNYPFKVLGQKQQSSYNVSASVTTVLDGTIKFFLDGSVSDVKALPFIPKNFEITITSNLIIISFSAEKSALFIYSVQSRTLVYSDVVDEFYITDNLTVKKAYKTVTDTFIEEEWSLSDTPILLSRRDVKGKYFNDVHPYLLPLAFFENLIIGASVQDAVTLSLSQKIIDLQNFLGKYNKVLPLDSESVYLIKPNAITIAKVEFENRLISNVLEEDCF